MQDKLILKDIDKGEHRSKATSQNLTSRKNVGYEQIQISYEASEIWILGLRSSDSEVIELCTEMAI